jgi:regulator of replication initiation timing
MQVKQLSQIHGKVLVISALLLVSPLAGRSQTSPSQPSTASSPDLKALTSVVLQLQSQVQSLNAQVSEMRDAQQRALQQSQELRAELDKTKEQLMARKRDVNEANSASPSQPSSPISTAISVPAENEQEASTSLDSRVSKLEDDQELMNDKLFEQSQTKIESGSKYRVRLSGIVLLNTAITRGSVDNLDFPQMATPPVAPGTSGAFSGSLRQSQIGLEAFGPDIAGAHTSANIKFDFAGGFPYLPNGVAFGVMRLRTGTVRFDWENTSIVAGQDSLFFAPLTPTTLASLAIPALSYSGNLWSWTPQIRVEHRIPLSEASHLVLQAGILDSLTGDEPPYSYRYPTAGEQSGQPAYATRVAWSHRAFDRELTLGMGGYYGRQNWGYGRSLDGWAFTSDISIPLGSFFDLGAEFYRGRGVGGLGGGVGQSVLLSGPIGDETTAIHGLDSMGGWAQLKFKPKANFEVNFAYGEDNPFASELRAFPASSYYYGYSISRNLSPIINFIYRARSDVLFSVEYRRLQTYALDGNPDVANQVAISLGYLF